jgi:hypothetical protein
VEPSRHRNVAFAASDDASPAVHLLDLKPKKPASDARDKLPFLRLESTEAGELKSQTAPSSPRFGVENEPIKIGEEVNTFVKFFLIIFLRRFQRRKAFWVRRAVKIFEDFSAIFLKTGAFGFRGGFFW